MEEVGQAADQSAINHNLLGLQAMPGVRIATQANIELSHKRRVELLDAITQISRVFEQFKINGSERCLVGQLCQTLLQFRN